MARFEVGDRVKMTRGANEYLGEIKTVYDYMDIAVITLDNGQTEKVAYEYLTLYQESTEAPDDVITISRVELIDRLKTTLLAHCETDWAKCLYYTSALSIIDAELVKIENES